MQVVEDIKPSYPLFRDDQYKDMLINKQQQFEEQIDATKLNETFQWTTTLEYQELNFKREALTINNPCWKKMEAPWLKKPEVTEELAKAA